MVCVRVPPEQIFFIFLRKKDLFRLVVLPCLFSIYEKRSRLGCNWKSFHAYGEIIHQKTSTDRMENGSIGQQSF